MSGIRLKWIPFECARNGDHILLTSQLAVSTGDKRRKQS